MLHSSEGGADWKGLKHLIGLAGENMARRRGAVRLFGSCESGNQSWYNSALVFGSFEGTVESGYHLSTI